MAHINSHGYAVVDTDPNTISDLQSGHEMKIAVSSDGNNLWRFVESNSAGTKWLALPTNGGTFPLPIVSSILPNTLNHNSTQDIIIKGSYFTTGGANLTINSYTVNSFTVVDDNTIEANITSNSTDGFYDLTVSNVTGSTTVTNGIETKLSTWVDLRFGGDTFTDGNAAGNDIRYRTGMSMVRDVTGMSFIGSTPWSSWVKFESLGWTRGSNKTMQWIFSQPSSNIMIGIGSDATNETNTAQYQQAETEAYFNSATSFWGLYGNNGNVGTAGNQGNSTTIGTGTFKIKFTNDGGVGGVFTLYQLPSANLGDWDNESTVLRTFTIGGTLNPDETNIMPFIIPQNGGTQRFIALKIE